MRSLESDVCNVKNLDELNKLVSDAIYFKSDLREYSIGNAIMAKFEEFIVYEGVVVSYGFDSVRDLYYVIFWSDDRLIECIVRNEFDYYALETALKKVDLKYPVVLSLNGVLKQEGIEIKFNEALNVVVKDGIF